jgi:hypothetical protein
MMTMGEYEDRYPDAYGHGEDSKSGSAERQHSDVGLLRRQARGGAPATDHLRRDADAPAARAATSRPVGAVGNPQRGESVVRSPREICDDVWEQLNASPFIDASGINVSVDGSDVMLDGTINSLMAIALAQAVATNVAGVRRVQTHLRVNPAYATTASPRAGRR